MDEASHTVQRSKKNRVKYRPRKKYSKGDQPQISVSIGSLCLCALDHVTPRSMNDHEETIITPQFNPERLPIENEPYLNVEEDSDDEDHFEVFMTKDGNRPRPLCYTETVKAFCHSETLRELISNNSKLSSKKICLVDDMANDGSRATRVGIYKPLTSWELYHKLKKQRFQTPKTAGKSQQLNVDRRLSFAADPDSHVLAAIMLTAPELQVISLIDFFYYYTSFRPHIRFSKTPRGHLNFNQQFHLPFYSWRYTKQEPKDNRFKTDGSPLRNVHNMRFLRGKSSKKVYEVDYLCEAQLSVLVTAFDQRVWTGYCFVDVYYQAEGRRQATNDYCKIDRDVDSLQTDPFTNGECDSEHPILDPDKQLSLLVPEVIRLTFYGDPRTFGLAMRHKKYIGQADYVPGGYHPLLGQLRAHRRAPVNLRATMSGMHPADNVRPQNMSARPQERPETMRRT
ncbi:hypothetical protein FIE12Z_2474 [Fusarium flagelliforme]|uniref:Uncharacterized protein n=1 Tax=Fusarium flagelliforme TaxID=2675880 RepID=A0A395N023_9HYPO|nr:hypothetical protein FIE12Z_2474 [Fusarium flagelliforme]